jgi:hypothetical protein
MKRRPLLEQRLGGHTKKMLQEAEKVADLQRPGCGFVPDENRVRFSLFVVCWPRSGLASMKLAPIEVGVACEVDAMVWRQRCW